MTQNVVNNIITGSTATSTATNLTTLSVLDSVDQSHAMSIIVGTDLTADRTLTITAGDANRALDISAADVTVSAYGATLVDDADAGTARTTLGLVIGTNVQAYDAGLQSIAGLTTAANTLIYTTALDTYAVISASNSSVLVTSGAGVPSLSTAIPDGVTATTQSASDNSTKLATTAYADNAASAASGANAALSNLSGVAINESLISDTDITDDLGSASVRWANIYGSTLRTGDTGTDTMLIQARNTGGSWTTFITLTAAATPTCVLSGDITGVTQSASDNSTKLATTAYVDTAVSAGGGATTYLGSVTASASATVDFDNLLDGTYNNYFVVYEAVQNATDTTHHELLVGTGATPTYQTSSYSGNVHAVTSTTGNYWADSGTAALDLTYNNASFPALEATNQSLGGITYVFGANSALYKTMHTISSYIASNAGTVCKSNAGGQWQSATVITSLRFQMASGNVTAGTYRLYGIANS